MNDFLRALIHPDFEIDDDRAQIAKAAGFLQVGEFQLLQLAYADWFGEDLPEALVDKLFADMMFRNQVPHWARHYARRIIDQATSGALDDQEPAFHRYDSDYHTHVPRGVQRFCFAVAVCVLAVAGSVFVADRAQMETGCGATSVLPPFFDACDLPANR